MNNVQTKTKFYKQEIIKLFEAGCKPSQTHKIGIEYERLPVFSVTSKAVDYSSEFGICNFLRNFAREENWDYIMDDYNIIGLKQGHDTITLEPGCQIEMSLEPQKTIDELKNIIQDENIVQCVILNSDIEKMKKLKDFLKENFPKTKIVNESKKIENPDLKPSKKYYCDIVSMEVSKGTAVSEMCKYLNIKTEEIITIGDGENDVSMFNITPYSVVMGNALDNIKKHAKYKTATNDEDGVAKVLERLEAK